MAAWKLTEVPTGTFGPYLAEGPRATLAVWAQKEGDNRHWFAEPLSEQGQPLAERRSVADAPADIGLISVRPLGIASDDSGFVVLDTSRDFSGARLDALAIAPDGQRRGGPSPIAQSLPEITWIDGVPTDTGALVFWAIKKDNRASIQCVELGPRGELRGPATEVLGDARAWQVTATPGGAALGAVTSSNPPGETGPVSVVFVDARGKAARAPLTVSKEPTAELDLDLMFYGDRLVLAWTDRREFDWRVFTAGVDLKGSIVEAPKALTDPFGPQALIRLVPPVGSRSPAFAVWEDAVERPARGRKLRVGRFTADGALGAEQGTLDFASEDGSMPELSGTSNGLAAITLAPLCQRAEQCEDAPVAPTFVRWDEKMDVVASEPIRLSPLDGAPAELAWNLSCRRFECLALSAVTTAPAPILAVQLGPASNAYAPAARRYVPETPPRVAALTAVARSDSISDLAVSKVGETALVSWVTYFDPNTPRQKMTKPAPDGRMAPVEALLKVVPASGGEPQVISYRALSLGGVALSADALGKEALLAWAAMDQKNPQVFLTVVGPDAKKRRQTMLTRAPGEVSDVTAADVGDGWIVAWVDERSGHSQVFAAKVDRQLRRIGPERVLSTLVGPASDVQLLVAGQHVFVVWAQAADVHGIADIYATRVSTADASPVGPAHAVVESREHSHSPEVAAFDEGAIVAWLEELRNQDGSTEGALVLRRLDSGAEAVGSPVTLDLEGAPQSASIVCHNRICRIVAETSVGNVQQLEALEWSPEPRERYGRLLSLSARPNGGIDPVQSDNAVYYADPTPDGTVLIRRADLVWAP